MTLAILISVVCIFDKYQTGAIAYHCFETVRKTLGKLLIIVEYIVTAIAQM